MQETSIAEKSRCAKGRRVMTLDDLFTHDTGYRVTPSDIERLSGGIFTRTSVLRDIRAGHLRAGVRDREAGQINYYVSFEDAQVYLKPFRPVAGSPRPWKLPVVEERPTPEPPTKLQLEPRYYPRVYFVYLAGFIKIGIARILSERLQALQLANPHELAVLHQIGLPTWKQCRALEQELHERFAVHRHRGEWFRDCEEIRAYIAQSGAEAA